MTIRVAINGFGRIGRMAMRASLAKNTACEVVAINDLCNIQTCAHLLKYDSVHGRLKNEVAVSGDNLLIDGRKIKVSNERNPAELPWGEQKVDVVLECSGVFTDGDKAAKHLQAGARKVLISAPASNVDHTVVYGVNHHCIDANTKIISNASCTTNCLAPVAQVLNDKFGIVSGYMTTVHSFTGDQQVVDSAHSDLRRARAASVNLIPTSTGAARAVSLVIPELKGKLDGCAIRVPTADVSLIDLTFKAASSCTAEQINAAMLEASNSKNLHGVLAICDEPLVSSDFIGHPASSIFDLTQTSVLPNDLVHVIAWYDNEWGFTLRMFDNAELLAKIS